MTEREISLMIPTMNHPQQVDRLLGTLQDKGYMNRTDFKPVVVDSSLDNATKNITLSYDAEYMPAENLGKSKAMNYAIDHLPGSRYIAFVDDDIVILDETWMDKLMRNFSTDHVGYVSGRVVAANIDNEAAKQWEGKGALNKGPKKIVADQEFYKKFRLRGVPVNLVTMGANHVVRRDVLEEVGGHDERFGPGEAIGGAGADLDLTYKVLRAGYTVVYDPEAKVAHHHPEDLEELKAKLHVYGHSDTAIHLKFWREFGDWRSAFQLAYRPLQNLGRAAKSVLGLHPLRADVLMAGVKGNIEGIGQYFKHRNKTIRTNYKGVDIPETK